MGEHRPNHRTSNYGWALWHLERAEKSQNGEHDTHARCAQARATLALIDSQETMHRGMPGDHGSTWSGETDECPETVFTVKCAGGCGRVMLTVLRLTELWSPQYCPDCRDKED